MNLRDATVIAWRMHAAWQLAKNNMEQAQDWMRSAVNKHRRDLDWNVNDLVYLDTWNLESSRSSWKLSDK